ncbi:MAG: NAD-dependent epimerase/dehydratase family protein [Candidatus Latescibacteria bacterium]|nr:NAD-dependent epimerase/dehydratase family protein [Candidatus Latescibacterota bacterium]
MANVLVTGANGFVGSHMTEALLQNGYQVRALVRKNADLQWIENLPIEICYGAIADNKSLDNALDNIDYVIHIAAATKGASEQNFYDANVTGTINLVNTCLSEQSRIKRFVFFSTLAVTGGTQTQECINESFSCSPVTRYGKTKLQAEQIILEKKDMLPSVILRISAVYGPRDTESLAYFKFLKKGIRPIFGNKSSLCFVADVVQSAMLAIEKKVASGSIYHISDGNSYTLDDIARVAEQILRKKTIRIKFPVPILSIYAQVVHYLNPKATVLSKDKVNELTKECWVCDIQKAVNELGFQPTYSLEQGLRETIKWYQEHKWL